MKPQHIKYELVTVKSMNLSQVKLIILSRQIVKEQKYNSTQIGTKEYITIFISNNINLIRKFQEELSNADCSFGLKGLQLPCIVRTMTA